MLNRRLKTKQSQEANELHELFSHSVVEAGRHHPLVSYALMGLDLEILWDSVIGQTLETSLEDAIQYALPAPSCGATANAISNLFTDNIAAASLMQTSMNGTKYSSLSEFTQAIGEVAQQGPALVRISLHSHKETSSLTCHDYILFVTNMSEQGEPLGYVYQSNIAEGMEDNAFSLLAWFQDKDKSKQQNLFHHLVDLDAFLKAESNEERTCLYQKIYIGQPIVPVIVPANLASLTHNQNFSCSYKVVAVDVQNAFKKISKVVKHAYKNESSFRSKLNIRDQDDLVKAYMKFYYEKTQVCYMQVLDLEKKYSAEMKRMLNDFPEATELLALCKALLKGTAASASWSTQAQLIMNFFDKCALVVKPLLSSDVKGGLFEDNVIEAVKAELVEKKQMLKLLRPRLKAS